MTTAIDIKRLDFNYGKLKVIEGLNLEIPRGISFGLLGANGSGKTTLIRLMVGLLKPASGNIHCLGKTPSPAIAKQIGYMPQLPSLYNELTVEQNIDFFANIYGLHNRKERAHRVEEVIKLIDLWEKRCASVSKLSGEPTVGLDPDVRAHFWDFFNHLTEGGTTIVITSHTMDDAAHCKRLAFLRLGRIIAQGAPDELRSATGNPHASLEETFLYFIKQSQEVADVH
jgi:ABC-2 type transport system ATP-binding protein